jgi:hypothetical protein
MSWNPTKQVIDLTGLVDNTLRYIGENQAEAIRWASGERLPAMTLYPSASGRLATKFPQLLVLSQEHGVAEGAIENGDVLVIDVALLFEGALTHHNLDELVQRSKQYARAVDSMLENIPPAVLLPEASHAWATGRRVVFDVPTGYGQKRASSWIQIYQIRADFRVIAPAF